MVDNQNIGPIIGGVTVGIFGLIGLGVYYVVKSDKEESNSQSRPLASSYGGRGRTRRHRRSSRDTRKRRH